MKCFFYSNVGVFTLQVSDRSRFKIYTMGTVCQVIFFGSQVSKDMLRFGVNSRGKTKWEKLSNIDVIKLQTKLVSKNPDFSGKKKIFGIGVSL